MSAILTLTLVEPSLSTIEVINYMKKLFLPLAFTALMVLGACGGRKSKPTPTPTAEPIDPSVVVTVNYYLDYNDTTKTGRYYSESVNAGSLLTKPTDPTTSPQSEFPVFLGWSTKEIIDNKADLWDFSKDVVPSKSKLLSLFAIWVATGEK